MATRPGGGEAKGPVIHRPRIGLAIAIGVVLGLAGTLMLLRAATPPRRYLGDPTLRYAYRYEAHPSPQQIEMAEGLRRAGYTALKDNKLALAVLYFGQCVEMSDETDCHREVASILYMLRDQAANAHRRVYVKKTAAASTPETPRP